MKEYKAPDKVAQKMTRAGAVAENLTTGATENISSRPAEENISEQPVNTELLTNPKKQQEKTST